MSGVVVEQIGRPDPAMLRDLALWIDSVTRKGDDMKAQDFQAVLDAGGAARRLGYSVAGTEARDIEQSANGSNGSVYWAVRCRDLSTELSRRIPEDREWDAFVANIPEGLTMEDLAIYLKREIGKRTARAHYVEAASC